MDYWREVRAAFGPGTVITVGAGVIVRRGETVLLQRRSDGGRIEHVALLYEATDVEGDPRRRP